MCRFPRLATIASVAMMLVAGACGNSATEPPEGLTEDFLHSDFDESSVIIDNRWFPLVPGTQLVFEGSVLDDDVRIPHSVIFTVTDLVKRIDGIDTVVIWDQDFTDGELVETELAFFAQDKNGIVWHLGQYPEEYEAKSEWS